MKVTTTILVGAFALTACTPQELRAFARWHREDPAAAEAYASQPAIQAELQSDAANESEAAEAFNPGTLPPVVDVASNARGHCAEWYDEAMAAGFTDDQWGTVDRIMWGESRCRPGAHNRSGATGLMQIMPSTARSVCPPGDLYDPQHNLNCAVHVKAAQGWNAWSVY